MNRIPLPVIREVPEPVECTACAKCCTYVGVDIDKPRKARCASDILWYLYHENVYVYVDGNDDWSVHFEGRCRNLGDDLRCLIYEQRPDICRGFDNTSCEVNDHEHESLTFRQPTEFLAWLRENRPKVYKRVEKKYLPPQLRLPDQPRKGKKGKKEKARKS